MVKTETVKERFPLTLGVVALDIFAFVTLPFLALSVATNPVLSATSQVLLTMFLTGMILLIITSVAFTGGFTLLKPEKPFERFTQGQALLVLIGFGLVAVWQLYVNQAVVLPALATLPPVSSQAVTFAIDNALAEEALMGAFTIVIFLTLRYFKRSFLEAAVAAMLSAAAFFTWLHTYPNVYGNNPQALIFVFGARLVLAGVLLGTLKLSRFANHPSASLAAPPIIHVTWNLSTLVG